MEITEEIQIEQERFRAAPLVATGFYCWNCGQPVCFDDRLCRVCEQPTLRVA